MDGTTIGQTDWELGHPIGSIIIRKFYTSAAYILYGIILP